MSRTENDEMVEALAFHTLYKALGDGILIRCPNTDRRYRNALRRQNGIELLDELAIAIAQQVLGLHGLVIENHGYIAGLLCHPTPIRIGRRAEDMHAATAQMDEEQDEHFHPSSRRPHFFREEVAGPERVSMALEEVEPRSLAATRARIYTIVPPKNAIKAVRQTLMERESE